MHARHPALSRRSSARPTHRRREPIDRHCGAGPVEPSFGAPGHRRRSLTPASAPQAGGSAGPSSSIDEDNLDDLSDDLYRDSDDWSPGAPLRVGFPQSHDGSFRSTSARSTTVPTIRGNHRFFDATQQGHAWQALYDLVGRRQHHFRAGRARRRSRHLSLRHGVRQHFGGVSTGVDQITAAGSRSTRSWTVPEMEPGSGGFETLIHEIGHSLGLRIPATTMPTTMSSRPTTTTPSTSRIEDVFRHVLL